MTRWEDMIRLLEDERDLLMEGRIADLPAIAERKVGLLTELSERPAPEPVLRLAERNAALLDAAARGLKSAMRRIEDARGAGRTQTYDARGERHHLTPPPPSRGFRA